MKDRLRQWLRRWLGIDGVEAALKRHEESGYALMDIGRFESLVLVCHRTRGPGGNGYVRAFCPRFKNQQEVIRFIREMESVFGKNSFRDLEHGLDSICRYEGLF